MKLAAQNVQSSGSAEVVVKNIVPRKGKTRFSRSFTFFLQTFDMPMTSLGARYAK
jgi:hypothetical protein